MAGEEFVPKDQYKAKVKEEMKSLIIQVGVLVALSIGLSLTFYLTLTGAQTAAE